VNSKIPHFILPVLIHFPIVPGKAPPAVRARLLLKRLARRHHARCEWLPDKALPHIQAAPMNSDAPDAQETGLAGMPCKGETRKL